MTTGSEAQLGCCCAAVFNVDHEAQRVGPPAIQNSNDMVLLLSCRCLRVLAHPSGSARQQARRHCLVKGTMLQAAQPR